jgi:carboxypeptidase D
MNHYSSVFSLNETFMRDVSNRAESCGLNKFLDEALVYPPPKDIFAQYLTTPDNCAHIWNEILEATKFVNPCFNINHLTDFCPYLWDQIPLDEDAPHANGPNNYFDRSDVQKALNVPHTDYTVCGGTFHDTSPPSAWGPLPKVIEQTNNTVISHGWLDYTLFVNSTLIAIQNMTWNGAQGFQKPPTESLYIPYPLGEHTNNNVDDLV